MRFSCATTLTKYNPCTECYGNDARALLFEKIARNVLSKEYELSVVFIGNRRSQTLNRVYRGKNIPANILSFPLSKTTGEIFINPFAARKEARLRKVDTNKHIAFLFIHGLLHLKGYQHSSKMEYKEEKLVKKFLSHFH